jgi:hypothetical protein
MALIDRKKVAAAFRSLPGIFVLGISVLAIVVMSFSGCDSESDEDPSAGGTLTTSSELEKMRPQITAFCAGCHEFPDPAAFPKNSWHHEVEKAYEFFRESNREDLKAPPMTTVVHWFREQAPDNLTLSASNSTPSPLRFRQESLPYDAPPGNHSISGVFFQTGLGFGKTKSVRTSALFCDMGNGVLGEAIPNGDHFDVTARRLPRLNHPARIQLADLDGNGRPDYVISDLGSFLPEDHDQGQVLWFRPDASGDQQTTVLMEGIGRVADARPADFDGDGDQDLIVAEFGWHKTGSIHFLKQVDRLDGIPKFTSSVIDDRHGTIHVPVTDLDKDGDLDFVALISQEYEEIAAFLNRGDGTFERQIIQPGGEPAFGSSGIELADIDGDGDVDVLYVNGDSLDSNLMKPYHGVRWLENDGDFPFKKHLVGLVPGACRAVAGDLDQDGDLDIVAGAWIPPKNVVSAGDDDGKFDTLLWFEQTSAGKFERHSLIRSARYGFMAADLGDLDADGKLDIVAARFGHQPGSQAGGKIEIFWNAGKNLDAE